MKYCPNCGKELFDEALMCPECKISFLKYHKLTFLHRYQALPLINPAISISVDGYKPVPVVKSDSVVYKLCSGMHHIKLTGKARTAEFDINLTDNIIIMAEWNAATGGIDHRETVGEIIDSVPVNFEKEVENSKVEDSKKEQQTPSEHDESAELNESVEDNQKGVDDSNAVKSSNAKSDEKSRNEKELTKTLIGIGCCVLVLVILIGAMFASIVENDKNNNHYSQSTTVADSEKSDTENTTETTTETTESKNSACDMVSLDDYKQATQNINLGSDSIDISVDNFRSSYDGTGVVATLYFENIDVGAIIIATETVGSTEYIKRITVSASLSEFSDKIQTKQDAVAIGASISMSAIMPLLNNCRYFDSNDIAAKLKYSDTTDGKTVEGDSNNYHYSYSQPSYTQIFIGCEFKN